jgi:hypothetical protein
MHLKVENGIRFEKHGWTYISIQGSGYERGLAYGKLMKNDMKEILETVNFIVYNDFGVKWDFFVKASEKYYTPTIQTSFPEFYEEMSGFAEGAEMDLNNVVAWNNYFALTEGWWANMPEDERVELFGKTSGANVGSREGGSIRGRGGRIGSDEKCSAFIAVGDWTKDGKIVVAHNNFSNFIDGQFAKYVIDINPSEGNRILMMGFGGWIWSGTDFFVTSAGFIGTETTIGGFTAFENNLPISCRIRQAMQYGNSLEDYERILLEGNSGDYANSWLFGDIHNNEIMRIELGLKYHNTQRTKNGYFIGFNAPYDPRIRNLECSNTGFDDIRRHQGARRVRLDQLMKKYKGKLDIKLAKEILADHYDVYLKKNNPCSRTCCSHYELDNRAFMSDPSRPKPYQPRGALDGNVCDSTLAKHMSFVLRWGNSCGMTFDKDKFCDKHPEWGYLRKYLHDRPKQPWTLFSINGNSKTLIRKTNKIKLLNNLLDDNSDSDDSDDSEDELFSSSPNIISSSSGLMSISNKKQKNIEEMLDKVLKKTRRKRYGGKKTRRC